MSTINEVVADYTARQNGPVDPLFPRGLQVIVDNTLVGDVMNCFEDEILVNLSSGLTALVNKSRIQVLA